MGDVQITAHRPIDQLKLIGLGRGGFGGAIAAIVIFAKLLNKFLSKHCITLLKLILLNN